MKQASMVALLSICSVLFVLINISSAQSPCRTPKNQNGNCIALRQCGPLFRILTSDPTREQQLLLRNSKCGGDNTHPLVCCPNTFTIADMPSGRMCGTHVADKIFGGERAALSDFPWLALLQYRKPNGHVTFSCGGSLINERYVLTAAHCIRNAKLDRLRYVLNSVRLGENDLRTDPDCQDVGVMWMTAECADSVENIPVAELIVHEKYNPSSQLNDIALIRLQRPATFTNYTRQVCLPFGDLQDKNFDGLAMQIAGFGRTESATKSDFKMKLKVNGVNWAECSSTYLRRATSQIGTNVLCAGGEAGKDSCGGDSGGPLVAEESRNDESFSYLVGVVSLGPTTCGTAGFPGVYTRVDKYIYWILDHMTK